MRGRRYDQSSMCRRCLEPYDREPVDGVRQRCRCERRDEPTWPGYDFNTRIELCNCCQQMVLRSGSRWSVWFCPPCKELTLRSNDHNRRWLIPIGRHSFMVRTYERADAVLARGGPTAVRAIAGDAAAAHALDGFVDGIRSMVSSHEVLDTWRRETTRWLLDELEFPPDQDADLTMFVERVRAAGEADTGFGRADLFRRLSEYMAGSAAERR